MALKLYIVPAVADPEDSTNRVPKYIYDLRLAGKIPECPSLYYGAMPQVMVCADVLPADDAILLANADAFGFPEDLNLTLGGQGAQRARNFLQVALIPEQTVNAGNTWRDVARLDYGMFEFMNRLNNHPETQNVVVIDSSSKLNAQWSVISTNVQTAILQTAASFSYPTAFIQPNTQIRQIIQTFGNGWIGKQFKLGPLVF